MQLLRRAIPEVPVAEVRSILAGLGYLANSDPETAAHFDEKTEQACCIFSSGAACPSTDRRPGDLRDAERGPLDPRARGLLYRPAAPIVVTTWSPAAPAGRVGL